MTHAAAALIVQLVFTLPSTEAYRPDSTTFVCQGGAPLRDLAEVRAYAWSVTGGPATLAARKDVRGRAGQPCTLSVAIPGPGAHFWVAAVDTAGNEACASDMAYSGPVTGVEIPPADRVLEVQAFDVRGRRIRAPAASGIYFFRTRWASGRLETKRVVVLK